MGRRTVTSGRTTVGLRTASRIGRPPPGCFCRALAAEPPLALIWIDPGPIVIATAGHVIDPLARGADVALDPAAGLRTIRARLHEPLAPPPVPGRHEVAAPHAERLGLGPRL